jgi:hypothetical protein
MPEASVRRDGTGNPDQRKGQRQLAGGMESRRYKGQRQLAGGMESRRYKGQPQLAGGMNRLCLPAGSSRCYRGRPRLSTPATLPR